MLSIKENFLETIHSGGKPDRLVNCYEFMGLVFAPAVMAEHNTAVRGEMGTDAFGVTWKWAADQPAPAPWHTPETIVLQDVLDWESTVIFPDIDREFDYSGALAQKKSVEDAGLIPTVLLPGGIFERLHMLLGFEGALVALMLEPEATGALMAAISEHKMKHARMVVEHIKPEAVLIHDDWGMKTSMFMQPDLWREFLKPHYEQLNSYFKDNGIITIHHADSFLEPIVPDMAEIGIDVWQGTLPQNDIARLQKQLAGKMTLMGGVDVSVVDVENGDEQAARAHVRKTCEDFGPAGHFIPCYTTGGPGDVIYPGVQDLIEDEIRRYNEEIYGHKYGSQHR